MHHTKIIIGILLMAISNLTASENNLSWKKTKEKARVENKKNTNRLLL